MRDSVIYYSEEKYNNLLKEREITRTRSDTIFSETDGESSISEVNGILLESEIDSVSDESFSLFDYEGNGSLSGTSTANYDSDEDSISYKIKPDSLVEEIVRSFVEKNEIYGVVYEELLAAVEHDQDLLELIDNYHMKITNYLMDGYLSFQKFLEIAQHSRSGIYLLEYLLRHQDYVEFFLDSSYTDEEEIKEFTLDNLISIGITNLDILDIIVTNKQSVESLIRLNICSLFELSELGKASITSLNHILSNDNDMNINALINPNKVDENDLKALKEALEKRQGLLSSIREGNIAKYIGITMVTEGIYLGYTRLWFGRGHGMCSVEKGLSILSTLERLEKGVDNSKLSCMQIIVEHHIEILEVMIAPINDFSLTFGDLSTLGIDNPDILSCVLDNAHEVLSLIKNPYSAITFDDLIELGRKDCAALQCLLEKEYATLNLLKNGFSFNDLTELGIGNHRALSCILDNHHDVFDLSESFKDLTEFKGYLLDLRNNYPKTLLNIIWNYKEILVLTEDSDLDIKLDEIVEISNMYPHTTGNMLKNLDATVVLLKANRGGITFKDMVMMWNNHPTGLAIILSNYEGVVILMNKGVTLENLKEIADKNQAVLEIILTYADEVLSLMINNTYSFEDIIKIGTANSETLKVVLKYNEELTKLIKSIPVDQKSGFSFLKARLKLGSIASGALEVCLICYEEVLSLMQDTSYSFADILALGKVNPAALTCIFVNESCAKDKESAANNNKSVIKEHCIPLSSFNDISQSVLEQILNKNNYANVVALTSPEAPISLKMLLDLENDELAEYIIKNYNMLFVSDNGNPGKRVISFSEVISINECCYTNNSAIKNATGQNGGWNAAGILNLMMADPSMSSRNIASIHDVMHCYIYNAADLIREYGIPFASLNSMGSDNSYALELFLRNLYATSYMIGWYTKEIHYTTEEAFNKVSELYMSYDGWIAKNGNIYTGGLNNIKTPENIGWDKGYDGRYKLYYKNEGVNSQKEYAQAKCDKFYSNKDSITTCTHRCKVTFSDIVNCDDSTELSVLGEYVARDYRANRPLYPDNKQSLAR